jgi:hypothetical protein
MSNHVNKKPVLVWIIFILTLLGFIQFCFVFGVNNGLIHIDKEYSENLIEVTLFKNIKMLIMNIIFLLAGVMLFRLKLVALKLYVLYAILAIISLISSFIVPTPQIQDSFIDTTNIMFYSKLISIFITFLLVYYSFSLSKKKILKT